MPTSSPKRVYVQTAERALGHALPKGAIVHHVDVDRRNNRNDNLVILQSTMEHSALHRRLRVQQAGGDPWTEGICCACKQVKPLSLFATSKTSYTGRISQCKACIAKHVHRYFNRKKGLHPDHRESAEERRIRNTNMANRRWGNVAAV